MKLTSQDKYNKRKLDESKGKLIEIKVNKQLIKKYPDVRRFKNKYSRLDFIDPVSKIVFELKSAFNPYGELPSYMIGVDKYLHFVNKYKKKGYKFILLYNIIGNIVYCEIDDIDIFRTKEFSRFNGKYQEKTIKYAYIPRRDFIKFEYQYLPIWSIGPLNPNNC